MNIRVFIVCLLLLAVGTASEARTKLAALPERGRTLIRLDNPRATLIEEDRTLTLQKGLNKVDFSWTGVNIDADSIRLTVLTHRDQVTLLNVSYPPDEAALVWEINSSDAFEVTVRISYLLSFIDRLTTYKLVAEKDETRADLKGFLVLRNFSGEDFADAEVVLEGEGEFRQGISHGETRQVLYLKREALPLEKRWTFDARKLPWDPEGRETNVGIPVTYRIKNDKDSGLGLNQLRAGKARVFQEDGRGSTIFLGEDMLSPVPLGGHGDVYIGDSRDIVVTQRKMHERRINIRRNSKNKVVLYDTDELIKARVENFKDAPATLTVIQHIPGQWDMKECNMTYRRRDASTLEFEISLPPRSKRELIMNYHRRNLR